MSDQPYRLVAYVPGRKRKTYRVTSPDHTPRHMGRAVGAVKAANTAGQAADKVRQAAYLKDTQDIRLETVDERNAKLNAAKRFQAGLTGARKAASDAIGRARSGKPSVIHSPRTVVPGGRRR